MIGLLYDEGGNEALLGDVADSYEASPLSLLPEEDCSILACAITLMSSTWSREGSARYKHWEGVLEAAILPLLSSTPGIMLHQRKGPLLEIQLTAALKGDLEADKVSRSTKKEQSSTACPYMIEKLSSLKRR